LGRKGNLDCKSCEGHGQIPMVRCPNSFDHSEVIDLFNAYVQLENYKILPFSGSMNDQSACFKKVVSLIPSMVAIWTNKAEEKRKFMEKMKNGSKV
jgi:hypothetical protein